LSRSEYEAQASDTVAPGSTWIFGLDVIYLNRQVSGRGGLQDRLLDSKRRPVSDPAVQRLLDRRSRQLTFAL
jgi:hypothetical protein